MIEDTQAVAVSGNRGLPCYLCLAITEDFIPVVFIIQIHSINNIHIMCSVILTKLHRQSYHLNKDCLLAYFVGFMCVPFRKFQHDLVQKHTKLKMMPSLLALNMYHIRTHPFHFWYTLFNRKPSKPTLFQNFPNPPFQMPAPHTMMQYKCYGSQNSIYTFGCPF